MKFLSSIFGLFQTQHVFIVFSALISVLFKVPTTQSAILASPELLEKPSSNIAIIMTGSTLPLINEISKMQFVDNVDRQMILMQSLKHFTGELQAPVIQFIKLFKHTSIQPMWVDNVIFVEGASPTLIQALLDNPLLAILIKLIRQQVLILLPKVFNVVNGEAPTLEKPAWGVSKCGCPEYWKKIGNGTGCRVATIDTGCNVKHEALKDNYIGTGGWHDPNVPETTGITLKPSDAQGHGSHCMGSICGAHGVGCAPGAKWMACRGCGSAFCTESDLCNCGQWLASCNDGKDADKGCPHTPHVISCSWGGTDGPDNTRFFDTYITMWIACRIFAVFALGNSGPDCRTAGYPGSNEQVCSVGSTNITDQVSSFSSRGPSFQGNTAPHCCAPGDGITSCHNLLDHGYKTMSGTSMATPHVAGCACLLLGTCPKAEPVDVKNAIMNSAVKGVGGEPGTCNLSPRNECGWGRVDCVKAHEELVKNGKC